MSVFFIVSILSVSVILTSYILRLVLLMELFSVMKNGKFQIEKLDSEKSVSNRKIRFKLLPDIHIFRGIGYYALTKYDQLTKTY